MKSVNEGIMECGFPIRTLTKIMASLEQHKVDYLMLEPRNNLYILQK